MNTKKYIGVEILPNGSQVLAVRVMYGGEEVTFSYRILYNLGEGRYLLSPYPMEWQTAKDEGEKPEYLGIDTTETSFTI